MRICEILNYDELPNSKKKKKELGSKIGQGKFSKVYTDFNDSHFIIKQENMFLDPNNNAFYQYVRAIKDQIDSNPFLPRIYVVNYKEKDGLYKFRYKIERLQSVRNLEIVNKLDVDVIKSLAENLLDNFTYNPKYDNQVNILWYLLIDNLHTALEKNDYSNIKDDRLIEALKLTRTVAKRFSLDMGRDNILLRLYPLQIVIADPVA